MQIEYFSECQISQFVYSQFQLKLNPSSMDEITTHMIKQFFGSGTLPRVSGNIC
mgnify:CR=1 FL=1